MVYYIGMKKYLLEIVVFVAGMGVMVFELIGSRILAPYVGTTIIVWSALIGVILAFLSAGYWWGGRVADKKGDYKYFSGIIFLSAFFIALTAVLKIPIINFLDQYFSSFQWEAICLSIILFGPATFFLAAIYPYAVRLRMHSIEDSGETVGNLSAVSSMGSIFGAFITGMFLVAVIGNTAILFILSAILLLASILTYKSSMLAIRIVALVVFTIMPFFSGNLDYHFLPIEFIKSSYLDVAIREGTFTYKDISTGESVKRPTIQLYTNPTIIQSAMFSDEDNELVLTYSRFFRTISEFFHPDIKRALLIGGAGYSIPKDFLKHNLIGNIDVVEIDPKMTEIAKEYFNLPDDPRLNIYHEDGRTYLNKNQKKYDVVMIDAFKAFNAPFHLTTLETVEKISNSLNDNGLVIINILQSIKGDSGKFFRAEYATFKEVFPQLYVFRALSLDPYEEQNLILVATKSSDRIELISNNKEVNFYLSQIWEEDIDMDIPILTDDFAPVAYYMLPASMEIK